MAASSNTEFLFVYDWGSICLLQDLLRYCSLALLLQIGISLLAAPRASRSHLSTAASIKRAADVLIAAVPTSIPAVITVGMFRCLLSLKSRHIEIHHIQKVKTVAAVDCAVFDKTGTLTGSMVSCKNVCAEYAHVSCFSSPLEACPCTIACVPTQGILTGSMVS